MTAQWSAELVDWVKARASEAGFDLAGVAAAPAAEESDGALTAKRFFDWVVAGHAGEMEYLKRRDAQGGLLRASARVAMPWARSIVVCAFNYHADAPLSIDPASDDRGWIGRYALLGDAAGAPVDYHDDLLARVRLVETVLRERVKCETRAYVDTGPLLERDFAARAGVGWVGKNTCVIDQRLGSWLLLAVIVTSIEMQPDVAALLGVSPDRCGSCTRCLEACPTGALTAPREMDASLCIAYLTIELKGTIPTELRKPMGRQVFGCDICQDVCPWNRRAPVAAKPGLATRQALVNPPLAELAALDADDFKALFRGSPVERTKLRRLHRNVAVAMGNTGTAEFRPQLEAWAGGEDELLAEHARWALAQLAEPASISPVHEGE